MKKLYTVDVEDGFVCEIVGCPNSADYCVGTKHDNWFICRSCYEKEIKQSGNKS